MTRILDPIPVFPSEEALLEEARAKRSNLDGGIAAESSEWFPGYTERAVKAIMEKDKLREIRELERARTPAPSNPIATTRLGPFRE
jgi:hypothetical protein